MDVILLERIEKLGQLGKIVKVKSGYARNYLIPQGKAVRATKAALAAFDARRAQIEADNLQRRDVAEVAKGEIEGRGVVIIRQASETRHLYGSVTARDIADAFMGEGVIIDRRQVRLDQPIKMLGIYDVRVALHPEVDTIVHVNVGRSLEEADIQAGKVAPPVDADEVEAFDDGAEAEPDFADIIEMELAEAGRE